MKVLRFFGKIGCCLAAFVVLAGADSIQLRDGRHLQGKYIGGTTTAIGFMTGGTVEYFATTDVLVLIFDNGTDTPLSGVQPNPMRGPSPARPSGIARARQISASSRDRTRQQPRQGATVSSNSQVHSDAQLDEKIMEYEPDLSRR